MVTPRPEGGQQAPEPVIGFVLLGGPLSGAKIRDIRLANELVSRGYRVHVWWAVDREKSSPLLPQIQQRWLFQGLRYARSNGSDLADGLGRLVSRYMHDKNRLRSTQKRPRIIQRVMRGFIERVGRGVEGDHRVVSRFARSLSRTGVTHLFPMLAILCPWAAAARGLTKHPLRYLVTFQGYELYSNYARTDDHRRKLFDRLREAVEASDWPAVAVSEDYLERVVEDVGVPRESLRAIPPGVPAGVAVDRNEAVRLLAGSFPQYRPEVPLVSYLGRRDTEKGIDLLLYAAAILRGRGLGFQVAVCGPTLFDNRYGVVCQRLARDLGCPVLWSKQISDELRSALFAASRCIVCPSVHREPFGMVAVEALAHGTPAIVPDLGGIASAIQADGQTGGLHFRTWDSAHLADQIARLLQDNELHRRLSEAGPGIAAHYSVEKLADRVLAHVGLPPAPPCSRR